MDKIKNSGKAPLTMLMSEAMKDVRSTTGSNYHNIMLLMGKTSIDDVKLSDVDSLTYFKLDEQDVWKISTIREIIETKAGQMEIPGFKSEELETILNHLCTN